MICLMNITQLKAVIITFIALLFSGTAVVYASHNNDDTSTSWPQAHSSTQYDRTLADLPDLDSSHYFFVKLLSRSNKTPLITDSNTAFNGTDLRNHKQYQSYLDKAQSKRHKLAHKWTKSFKLSVFKYQHNEQKHHFYLNTLRRELVGKANIGALDYSLRASRKRAKLSASYRF